LRFRILFLCLAILLLCPAAHAEGPPGDLNGDWRVDTADLRLLAHQWLTEPPGPADLNRDGRVDGIDLALLARQWGRKDCPIVINEVFPHAHGEASDWIELHNLGTAPVHLGGWFLSDTKNDLQRYQIAAGTTIGPREYLVLYEITHFGNPFDPGTRRLFAFSENGETACLYSGNDPVYPNTLIAQPFGASETGSSFGRYRTSLGTCLFVTMSEPTPGAANAYPRVGPVVIHEIMYHPAGNADAEYVELLNVSGAFLTLFDFTALEPWRLTDDAGVNVRLAAEEPVTLAPGEILLLVRDQAAMRQYDVPAPARVLSWSSGRLSNRGGTLRLLKPGDVDTRGTRYWIEVDRVDYSDGSHGQDFPGGVDPWPVQPDGYGFSLGRRHPTRFGNDPNNWRVTLPTPGWVDD